MRLFIVLILPLCLLLASCNRHHLPPIKNLATLQKDCATLYQHFPAGVIPTNAPDFEYEYGLGIRIIPENKWPGSILGLHPYMVCSYQGGIQIWITRSYHQDGMAYYVATNPELPPPAYSISNRFVFENTIHKGVYQVKQQLWPAAQISK